MSKPVRATLVFGLVSGLLLFPVAWLMTPHWGWPLAVKLTLWADATFYALLLARWSRTRLISILFPLGILLGAAIWPQTYAGFFLLGLGVFSWIRSGICFKAPALRRLAAEIIAVAGGAGLVAMCRPGTPLTWALAIWLFFLVQALYFFIMPGITSRLSETGSQDPFQVALREAKKAMDS